MKIILWRLIVLVAILVPCSLAAPFGSNSLKWLSLAVLKNPQKLFINSRNASDQYNLNQVALTVDCNSLDGLSKKQRHLCKQQPDLMPFIMFGAKMALAECQHQFHDRRWNCSLSDPKQRQMMITILNKGTREAAFLHAMTAASVAHAITTACSKGILSEHCSCDQTLTGKSAAGDFVWSGCSDNIDFGSHASREFVDAQDRIKKRNLYRSKKLMKLPEEVRKRKKEHAVKRILMNLHNHEAGRKTLSDTLRINCKCHGVSGSCEMKTCWKSIAPFRTVGDVIKEKFDGATEVGSLRQEGKNFVLEPKNVQLKRHTNSDLVYVAPSPDFCERDERQGALGTHGRACNQKSRGVDSCDVMCCGRDYKLIRQKRITKCNCRFQWCCKVQCDECLIEEEKAVCS